MPALSLSNREMLIRIARQTLELFVKTGNPLSLWIEDPLLNEPRACFVTLRKKESLRGCIGSLRTTRPLYEEVVKKTMAVASEDFRFSPVRPDELGDIKIEISVLSPLERIHSSNEIEVGRHGIYLEWKNRSGTFLPEVAPEMGWQAEEFIKACGREKMNLPEKAWPEVALYRFTTEKIKE